MSENFEFWNAFMKSGEISDYLKFKGASHGQGYKDAGDSRSYQ